MKQIRLKRRSRVILTCAVCGDKFETHTYRKDTAKYCSKKCWSIRQTELRYCLTCGKQITTYKTRDKKYCNNECRDKSYFGRTATTETRKKMSDSKQGFMPVNIWGKGDKHPFWNPNRSQVNDRWKPEYIEFRRSVLERDKYTCQICGDTPRANHSVKLIVDHIKPFALYEELRFNSDNGRVLCDSCHKKTDTYGRNTAKINKARYHKLYPDKPIECLTNKNFNFKKLYEEQNGEDKNN